MLEFLIESNNEQKSVSLIRGWRTLVGANQTALSHTIVYEILIQIRICFSVAVQTVLKDSTLEYACFFSSSEFTFFVCYVVLFMHMIVSTVKIQPNLSLFQYVVTVLHNFIHIGRYILSAMMCWSYLLRISINLSTCVCYQRLAANLLHKSISEF